MAVLKLVAFHQKVVIAIHVKKKTDTLRFYINNVIHVLVTFLLETKTHKLEKDNSLDFNYF